MGPLNATVASAPLKQAVIGITQDRGSNVRTNHDHPMSARLGTRQDHLSGNFRNKEKISAGEEALASLLGHVVLRDDAARYAHKLVRTFGGLGASLACPEERLLNACDNNERCVSILVSAHEFMKMVLREPFEERPILNNVENTFNYLSVSMAHETNEEMRILYLNKKNALLMDEIHARGTVDHVPIYPREVIKRVLEVGAGAVILVHNHPSGDPTPSDEDVEMTHRLSRILKEIGVRLHDHIIVGRVRCESMRNLKLI